VSRLQLIVMALLFSNAACESRQDGTRVKDVAREVEFYDSSIASIAGSYHLTIRPSRDYLPRRSPALMEGLRSDVQFVADLHSQRTRMDEIRRWKYSWFDKNDQFSIRELRTFDGNRLETLWSTFSESPVPVDVPREVPMYLKVAWSDTISAAFGPWHFCGLRLRGTQHRSLSDLVGRGVLTVLGNEEVDGHNCIVLTDEDGGKQWTLWIDPSVDFLPRKIRFVLPGGAQDVTLNCTSFAQFEDGSGNRRWFPTAGEAVANDWIYGYKLEKLQLNPDITDSDFVIRRDTLPPGVRVSDGGVVTYTGNDKMRFDELKLLTDARDRLMEQRYEEFYATHAKD
jgi:hypothetical protein